MLVLHTVNSSDRLLILKESLRVLKADGILVICDFVESSSERFVSLIIKKLIPSGSIPRRLRRRMAR